MNNTIENNKLIRTFMGLQPKLIAPDVYSYNDGVFFTSRGSLEQVSKSMDEYVKYHSDWNWLMDVLIKIKKLGYFIDMNYLSNTYGHIATSHYSGKTILAEISHKPNPRVSTPPTAENPIYINEFDDPKEALYNLIVRFIHWYNQQSK
jgi:hypothetical protein